MPTVDSVLQQAWAIHQRGQAVQAEEIYRRVLAQLPDHAAAWCYLGIALHDQHRYREAISAYEKAISLQPLFPIALNNLGNSLRYEYRAEEAEQCFLRAIALKPDYVNAHKNRGTLHVWNGKLELAMECYENALRLAPQDAELHRNLGVLHLLQGNFSRGWEEYRWRWRCPEMPRPVLAQALLTPDQLLENNLDGKTILLYSEQGLGDTLHFLRYAQWLKKKGAKVWVHGPVVLTALLSTLSYIDRWIPQSMPIEGHFDYHCSLIDVADLLQTDLTNVPSNVPYVAAAPYLVDYWNDWLEKRKISKFPLRVGIAWQGNRDHQADQFRSIPLRRFEPLSEVPGIQWFRLQQGYGAEQIADWQGQQTIEILPEGVDKSSGAFMDTAAIMQQLDLVITSDTSVAHLAGALGRPTWLLLSLVPDWRWLLHRPDTLWYPSMRLFRQRRQGDWSQVIQDVRAALMERTEGLKIE